MRITRRRLHVTTSRLLGETAPDEPGDPSSTPSGAGEHDQDHRAGRSHAEPPHSLPDTARFRRVESRRRARTLALGLPAELPRKNCWTIAEHAEDASPDGMQHLLARASWDAAGVRDDVRGYLVEHPGDRGAVPTGNLTVAEALYPKGAGTGIVPTAVACQSSTKCTAVAEYNGTKASGLEMIVGSGTRWKTAALPGTYDGAALDSISCPRQGLLHGPRRYMDESDIPRILTVTGPGSKWK
jgi:hypothetical protein